MEGKLNKLRSIIENSDNIVFFGGAGVSTESGIPDFRSSNGLYSSDYMEYNPEEILSHGFLIENTELFYQFYKDKIINLNARPNNAHFALAELERQGKLKCIVTQNIDGLHQRAGSKNVVELHGNISRNYCVSCNKSYSLSYIVETRGIPKCSCGGLVRPDVVLFEENLDLEKIDVATKAIKEAKTLIVAGTSLSVYPAADLVKQYQGDEYIIINLSRTNEDRRANLVIYDNVSEILWMVIE